MHPPPLPTHFQALKSHEQRQHSSVVSTRFSLNEIRLVRVWIRCDWIYRRGPDLGWRRFQSSFTVSCMFNSLAIKMTPTMSVRYVASASSDEKVMGLNDRVTPARFVPESKNRKPTQVCQTNVFVLLKMHNFLVQHSGQQNKR